MQTANAHREACVEAVAEAMGALHRLFDPAVPVFSDRNHGHDALALQIQVVVSLKMLHAAEKKVRKEERRRERKWEAKMEAKEEVWKGQLSESKHNRPFCPRWSVLEPWSESHQRQSLFALGFALFDEQTHN